MTSRAPAWLLACCAALLLAAAAIAWDTSGQMTHARGVARSPVGPRAPGTACAPGTTEARGTVVRVSLGDRGAMMRGSLVMHPWIARAPATSSTREVTFVAVNRGTVAHELLVARAPRGGAGARPVSPGGTFEESGVLAEASSSCAAGAGAGIEPGSTGWVTVRLAQGRYELSCDVAGHYSAGMWATFAVRAT